MFADLDRRGAAAAKAWVAVVMVGWVLSVIADERNFDAFLRGLLASVVAGGTLEQLTCRASSPLLPSLIITLASVLVKDQVVSSSLFILMVAAAIYRKEI